MLMKSRWLRLFAVLLALTVFAVSCGNDDDDGPGVTAGTPAPAAEEPDAEAPAEEAPAEEAPDEEAPAEAPAEEPEEDVQITIEGSEEEVTEGEVPTGNVGHTDGTILLTECSDGRPSGGTLTMGMFGEITGWDPTNIQGGASLGGTQMTAIYDGLFYLDLPTQKILPGLGESITTDDFLVFTLTLRQGINFSDGTPLDADAFIWNIQHHQRKEVGSQSAAQANLIAEMEKINDHTIEITLTGVNATFPQVFTNRLAWMMSPTAYQDGQDPETGLNTGINVNPVGIGAGPFIFESWIQDDEAVLVRNPDYFREGCPYLDKVVFKPIVEAEARYNAFKAGDLDMAFDRDPINLNDARDRGVNTTTRVDNHGGYWLLNNQKAPFNVRACRVALAHATDYDTANDIAWNGLRSVPRQVMKEGSMWHDPHPDAVLPGFDQDAAAAALEECEAELGGPLEFETFCTTDPINQLLTETLISMWAEVGITVTSKCTEVGEMVSAVFSGEAVANPWAIPVADPDYLYDTYYGHSPEDGVCGDNVSFRNWAKSCSPEFDASLTAGRQGLTFEERYEAYSRFQRKFAEQVPVIMLDKPETGYYYTDEVSGVFQSETGLVLLGFVAKG